MLRAETQAADRRIEPVFHMISQSAYQVGDERKGDKNDDDAGGGEAGRGVEGDGLPRAE